MIEIVGPETVEDLFGAKRLHVVFLGNSVTMSQSVEHKRRVVIELETTDLLARLFGLPRAGDPLVFGTQSLVKLPFV